MVGQLIAIVGARRKVSGQNLAAQGNGRLEPLGGTARTQFPGQGGDGGGGQIGVGRRPQRRNRLFELTPHRADGVFKEGRRGRLTPHRA